jgi:hypothetical protein
MGKLSEPDSAGVATSPEAAAALRRPMRERASTVANSDAGGRLVLAIVVTVVAQPLWFLGIVFGLMLCTTGVGALLGLGIMLICWVGMVSTWESTRELVHMR